MNDTQKLAYEQKTRQKARDLLIEKGIISPEFRALRSCDLEKQICRATGWDSSYLPFQTVERYVEENGIVTNQAVKARMELKKAEQRELNAMKRPPMKYSLDMRLAIDRLGDYKKPICLDSNVRFNVNLEADWRN